MFVEMRSIQLPHEFREARTLHPCSVTAFNEDALQEALRMAKFTSSPCYAIVHEKNIDYGLGNENGLILFNVVSPN